MTNRLRIFWGALAILIIGAGLIYYFYFLNANYLIPGVPYYGFYNHFFDADSAIVTSTAEILAYWGDNRFNTKFLAGYFFSSPEGNVATATPSLIYSTLDIQKFFKDNGYETYRWASPEAGGEIKEIKIFVNLFKKIPVIVYQKYSTDPERVSKGFRVVIGVSDKEKKITVHDHYFGNNYEISYEDFEKMFTDTDRAILAVWPFKELLSVIGRPNYKLQYPQRLGIMDKMGEYLIKEVDAFILYRQKEYENALRLQQEFVSGQKFSDFPPAYQVYFYSFLARLNLFLGDNNGAIELLTDKVLPINKDLSQPSGEWTGQINFLKNSGYAEDKMTAPFIILARAYFLKGDKKKALENYEKALKINPLSVFNETILQDYVKLKK